MSAKKGLAIALLDTAVRSYSPLTVDAYNIIRDALTDEELETLAERDEKLEALWAKLVNIPMDPNSEKLESEFLHFPPGTDRDEIWYWFDERHSKGIAYLLYHGVEDYVTEVKRLHRLNKLCFDCESNACAYNNNGICHFPLIHEREPNITEEDGCIEYCLKE